MTLTEGFVMWVEIMQDIVRAEFSDPFWRRGSFIRYDAKSTRPKKQHALVYQQGRRFGSVGDRCDYLKHDELLELASRGLVRLWRGVKPPCDFERDGFR